MAAYETSVRRYYQDMDKRCPTIARLGRNLNLCFLNGALDPCHHRDEIITTIQKSLLRKNKANILLTGAAGCGKTAIVEGLAAVITEKRLQHTKAFLQMTRNHKKALKAWEEAGKTGDEPVCESLPLPPLGECVIYDLSLNSMLSGTKYRGEFEERVEQVIQECKHNPNVVLFIDEVHEINRAGAAEGAISAAQSMKPALARKEIRVIGATTTKESEELLEDAAFARRFTKIEVPMLQGAAAVDTARNILSHYSAYHKVSTKVSSNDLLALIRYHLPDTVFPDNYINLVDETLAGAVFEGLTSVGMGHFSQTLSRMTGRLIVCVGGKAG